MRRLPDGLNEILRSVSRSFYLTLRVLPSAVRLQISLGYLLARAGDTIADTRLVPAEYRSAALRRLSAAILDAAQGTDPDPALIMGAAAARLGGSAGACSPAEELLLESIPAILRIMRDLPQQDRSSLGTVLQTILTGQQDDLLRFGSPAKTGIHSLETDAELDDYAYRVAGCVGEFWTRTCRAHLFPDAVIDYDLFLAEGVRFGKGLQFVNILRDLPADLRQGRCYLPLRRLETLGLQPQRLLDASTMEVLRPLYDEYAERALGHLSAGWHYTGTVPITQPRVRLACAWPILIGLKTLARLRRANVLDARQTVRVTRLEVRDLILQSIVRYPFPAAWGRLFHIARG